MKKGFAFTLTMLVVMFFVVTAVTLWAQAQEQKERQISQSMKYYVVSQGMQLLNEEVITRFSNRSAYYALYKLANWTVEHPLREGGDLPTTIGGPRDHKYVANVNKSIYMLMMNGTAEGNLFTDNETLKYTPEEKKEYTFNGFVSKVETSCNALGLNCSLSQPRNFSFIQVDPWTVQLYFEVDRNITTLDGSAGIVGDTVVVNTTFKIDGFIDPFVSRMMKNDPDAPPYPRRQIFRYLNMDNPEPSDVRVYGKVFGNHLPDHLTRGKGFVYGPIVQTDDVSRINISNAWRYIFLGPWKDVKDKIESHGWLDAFGGYIVTDVKYNAATTNYTDENSQHFEFNGTRFVPVYGFPWISCNWSGDIYCRMRVEVTEYSEEDCVFDCVNGTFVSSKEYQLCGNSGDWGDLCSRPVASCLTGTPARQFNFEDVLTESEIESLCNFSTVATPSIGMELSNPLNKPYIVTSRKKDDVLDFLGDTVASDYPINDTIEKTEPRVLINNEYWVDTTGFNSASDDEKEEMVDHLFDGYHEFWNIEGLRKLAMCESYVHPEGGVYAPSFFQRMLEHPEDKKGRELAIESFVVGRWAPDDYSKVDWEYALGMNGDHHYRIDIDDYIKGLPGNKNADMVKDSGSPIGHFGLSDTARERYGVQNNVECSRDVRCS